MKKERNKEREKERRKVRDLNSYTGCPKKKVQKQNAHNSKMGEAFDMIFKI